MSKILFLLRGLPGSGKSTLSKSLGGIHIEADQYFMQDGEYKFDSSKLKLAHSYCQSLTSAWMSSDGVQVNVDRIVVSNTFTQEWEMEPLIWLKRMDIKYFLLLWRIGMVAKTFMIVHKKP